MENSVAVIIPYYQKRKGLLADALRSVFAQTAQNVACIIVVDDGSPHPASAELMDFNPVERSRIVLIEQQNAGVSAARNSGLDSLPPNIDLVAFLDPDDRWSPGHIANALAAFEHGAMFYFSDFQRDNSDKTRFERSRLSPDPTTRLPTGDNLYRYSGSLVFDLVRFTMVGTSTVIMHRRLINNHRFWREVSAFEDLLFWVTCLFSHEDNVYFSTNCEAFYRSTDGLLSSAVWGSSRVLESISDHLRILHKLTAFAIGNTPFQDWIIMERRRLGHEFFINLRHRTLRFRPIDLKLLFTFLRVWFSPLPSMTDFSSDSARYVDDTIDHS